MNLIALLASLIVIPYLPSLSLSLSLSLSFDQVKHIDVEYSYMVYASHSSSTFLAYILIISSFACLVDRIKIGESCYLASY